MQDGTFSSPGYHGETGVARGDVFDGNCPTRQLLDRVGDKWSVLILLLLDNGERRFNNLKREIGGISQKMLAQTLRSLERDGLVAREAEATVPVTVTYAILPLGRELLGALRLMMEWAETRIAAVTDAQRRYDLRAGD